VILEELGLRKGNRLGRARKQAAMLRDALKATRELRRNS
jgi:hypothetical protein